jgi:hypothetical protein
MSSTVRDRTARSRIREYLAEHGPIVDPSGRATAVLKDAIGYEGSPVAFIQLVTAMDKSSEIQREIRGKRTYRISGLGSGMSTATPPRAHVAASRSAAPSLAVRTDAGTQLDVDYDELARALLRETWRLADLASAQTSSADEARELEVVRQERDQLIAERDEYARRLQQLSAMINGLAPSAAGSDSAESQGRRLLAELAREQGTERRERAS